MGKPCACVFENFHFTRIKMDAVRSDGVGSENAMLLQTVNHAHFTFAQAVIFIRFMFSCVNVKTRPIRCGSAASL